MSNKDYYKRWLALKEEFKQALAEDVRLQELAIDWVGIKPQASAVEVVSRVYSKYCELYNRLCDCYDQMGQVQRRPCIKQIIDSLTCRIIELKETLQEVEVFEFTYPDNAFQQLLIQPQDVEILCPFFYPFEMREAEMQYIMDQIFAGNRLGDPPLTEEELEQLEAKKQDRLERERKELADKPFDVMAETNKSVFLTPAEVEAKRVSDILNSHAYTIQRMERSRFVIKELEQKAVKDKNLYLDIAGLKKPERSFQIRKAAALLIQKICKLFMEIKRNKFRETKLKEKIGMVISSYRPPSAKVQLEKVKNVRREFRRKYYEEFLKQNIKEKSRVLKLREGDIMDDITDEIRQWFTQWFEEARIFDEFPWPLEGGSILIVKGETFTIEEYLEWRDAEEKRLKAESGNAKTSDQIKAEKIAAREEKKRLASEAKTRERKRLEEYRKSRMNPESDPGIYILIGQLHDNLKFNWLNYEIGWNGIDTADAHLDAIKGHIMQLITEDAYKNINLDLRPIADEMMRLELDILKKALKKDYASFETQLPLTKKRKKPKKVIPPKPEKITPEVMFQELADSGIVKKYRRVTLDDYWGDRNYAAADCRAILWTPMLPPPCIGDVKEQVRIRCILTLGSTCPNAQRSQLFVGPQGAGKKTLAYAVATETNSLLIDLSPFNVYNKFMGPKNQKNMFKFINKISRLMQPTVILVADADKLFYKKVPKEEKMFNPTRLSKDFFKEIIKPLATNEDRIIVIGTATEPWLSKSAPMSKVFPSTIMIPSTDYGSISYTLTHMLMKFHGVDRDFDVNSTAQTLRGYSIGAIKTAVEKLMSGKRLAELYYKPLQPMEIVTSVLDAESVYMGPLESDMYRTWYLSYSPWGQKLEDYMLMLESQLILKLKADKKNKNK